MRFYDNFPFMHVSIPSTKENTLAINIVNNYNCNTDEFPEKETMYLNLTAITLIAQPTYEIGKTAAELLLQRVADPTRPTRQVILKGQLLVRGRAALDGKKPHDICDRLI